MGVKVSWLSQEDGMVLGQHVSPLPAGVLGPRTGPAFTAFAPIIEPTLGTGVAALAAGAQTWQPRPG